jgi:hypothetical protein
MRCISRNINKKYFLSTLIQNNKYTSSLLSRPLFPIISFPLMSSTTASSSSSSASASASESAAAAASQRPTVLKQLYPPIQTYNTGTIGKKRGEEEESGEGV